MTTLPQTTGPKTSAEGRKDNDDYDMDPMATVGAKRVS